MIRRRTAILISGRGSNMRALVAAAGPADFPAEIALVLSNRADAAGLDVARAAGIATEVVSHRGFATREDFDRSIDAVLERYAIDLVCLAGFMRVLTPWFCERWLGRMISIHPALLPSFQGLDTHVRALDAGVRIHGATVHYVVSELDAGPIVAQGAVPVIDGDTAESLAVRVLAVEHVIYPRALALVAAGRVALKDGRVFGRLGGDEAAVLTVPDSDTLIPLTGQGVAAKS